MAKMTPLNTDIFRVWGTVTDVSRGQILIAGVSHLVGLGAEVVISKPDGDILGEVSNISETQVTAILSSPAEAVRIGDIAHVGKAASVQIGDHWLGQIVNSQGTFVTSPDHTLNKVGKNVAIFREAPPPHLRRPLGQRLSTGLAVTDTVLPLCQGQRIGLFAGSGVGKSTLLGNLASGLKVDRLVIALIGERSREVNHFVKSTLTEDARQRSVVVAATAGEPPGAKKRAAYCAMAAAEYFRDQGHSVLLVFDSITRFAEAHRETALMAGEAPALNAFPPSTVRVIAELVERSGPGQDGTGDITAIYSVLVAGSDMEEPVADMVRGLLDGHVVMSREIAERGRYPAIDILKSVSRSLPAAATAHENALLQEFRKLISLAEEVAPMLRAGLYEFGRDLETDRALAIYPALDSFLSRKNLDSCEVSFQELQDILSATPEATSHLALAEDT